MVNWFRKFVQIFAKSTIEYYTPELKATIEAAVAAKAGISKFSQKERDLIRLAVLAAKEAGQ